MHTPRNIQAPYVAADFWARMSSVNPRMALFIKVTPRFGDAVGLTSNTRDMTLDGHPGITFKATPGITPSTFETSLDEPSNLELTGIYQSGIFEHNEVINGKWNFAEVEVFVSPWDNTDLGELLYMRGNLGELKDYQTYFTAEGRGLISRLSNEVNPCTSRFCRVKRFCDAECGKDINDTVTIGGDTFDLEYADVELNDQITRYELSFLIDTPPAGLPSNSDTSGIFVNGMVTCTSGPNDGIEREIAAVVGLMPGFRVQLKRPLPFDAEPGDTFTFTAGCNRTIEDCMKYDNIVNRRAEDWVPGLEAVNRVPSGN